MSNVPEHHPSNCANSSIMAEIGNGSASINLIFLVWNFVEIYIIIRYDVVQRPAGRLLITNGGNGNLGNESLRLSII